MEIVRKIYTSATDHIEQRSFRFDEPACAHLKTWTFSIKLI